MNEEIEKLEKEIQRLKQERNEIVEYVFKCLFYFKDSKTNKSAFKGNKYKIEAFKQDIINQISEIKK